MPVCSYVIEPVQGQCPEVAAALNALPGCEATPSDGGELIVLVTDTPDEAGDAALQDAFKQVSGIANMTLTFGQIQPNLEAQDSAHAK